MHDYIEFPEHYVGSLGEIEQKTQYFYVAKNKGTYVVEKATGKGAFVRIYNDFKKNNGSECTSIFFCIFASSYIKTKNRV